MNACCFFGHREVHHAIRPLLLQAIRTMIEQMHVIDFYVGDKGCFDSMAFSCVKELQKEYPYIRLQVVLAYMPGQKAELEKDYTDTIYPENMETVPRRFAIVARNHWMADRCAFRNGSAIRTEVDRSFAINLNSHCLCEGLCISRLFLLSFFRPLRESGF